MAHIVNNHIIMAFYIDCIHTDICEQSVITRWLSAKQMVIIQIQAHSPQNTQTYMKNVEEKKKKKDCAKKPIAKLRPHQMTGASQRASRAVTRERQNSNKQFSVYLWLFFFFFGWSHSVWDIACYKIMLFFFYHQDAVFERNLFHNGHKQ